MFWHTQYKDESEKDQKSIVFKNLLQNFLYLPQVVKKYVRDKCIVWIMIRRVNWKVGKLRILITSGKKE
jgi:hypothetical protein